MGQNHQIRVELALLWNMSSQKAEPTGFSIMSGRNVAPAKLFIGSVWQTKPAKSFIMSDLKVKEGSLPNVLDRQVETKMFSTATGQKAESAMPLTTSEYTIKPAVLSAVLASG